MNVPSAIRSLVRSAFVVKLTVTKVPCCGSWTSTMKRPMSKRTVASVASDSLSRMVTGVVMLAYRWVRLETNGATFLSRHPRSTERETSCALPDPSKSRFNIWQPAIPISPALLDVARLMNDPPVSTDVPSVTMT